MFQMIPAMGLTKRLALWWSCTWRQTLITFPLWVVCILLLVAWVLHESRDHHSSSGSVVIALAAVISFCLVVCIPVIGYTVRNGFAAHMLTVPQRLTAGQAITLGLATTGWTMLASLPGSFLTLSIRHAGHSLVAQVLALGIHVLAAMYIVLPRQARRLSLLTDTRF